MEIKDIKQAVSEEITPLKNNIEEVKAKQAEGEKVIEQLKVDLKAAKDAAENTEIKDNLDKTIKAVEDMQAEQKRVKLATVEQKGFGAELYEALKGRETELKSYAKNRQPINIELKAVGNIGANSNFTQGTTTFAGGPEFGYVPRVFNTTHIRDVIGTQQTGMGDSITIIRDKGGEGAPTTVAKGGLKPQSDRDWERVVIPITKIAHWYRIPEEWLNDISWLQGEIARIGTEELMAVEDAELYSNNTAGEFTGLVENSTAFAAPSALALGVNLANRFDVLVAAWTQGRLTNENISAHLVNPGDFAAMVLNKATDGQYLFGPNQMVPNVLGVPVVPINQVAADKFISLDKNQATVAVREGISVRFYDQDGDNARYNLVTVVIEERIALVVRRLTGVIYGDFTDAMAALETA